MGTTSFWAALALLGVTALSTPARAQTPTTLQVNPETGETQAQFAKRTQWWRDAKFGMFIHWGIYAVANSDHANTDGMGEWWLSNHKMQVADYEKYAARFNPVKFDARAWVKAARDAGMKYIVITSKHHDGFDMFDSKLSDYTVVKATPWHHDPMKDLAAECKKQGITLCFYHSFMDWHHPDYLPRRPWDTRPTQGADLNRYVTYMEGQLRELLTNYGPIGGIWFDGGWEHDAGEEHSLEVVKLIRSLQPGVLINDRLQLPEDYSTPEQTIPANALPNGRLWETCMTINDHWGYAWNDTNFKSTADLVQKVCDIASKGGNFLLNVGPDAQGVIPAEEVSRLAQVGAWMKVNGASIYGTTKSPFRKLGFDGRCTQKGDTLYLQVFHWPDGGLRLSGLKTPVTEARALDGGAKLTVTADADGLTVSQPARTDPLATVVALRLSGPPVVEQTADVIRPDKDGKLTLLAADADIHGQTAQVETKGNVPNIGYWINAKDTVSWTVDAPKAGDYTVAIEYACADENAGSTCALALDSPTAARFTGPIVSTGGWDKFQTVTLPQPLTLSPGRHTLWIVPQTMPHGAVMNLRRLVLTPTEVRRDEAALDRAARLHPVVLRPRSGTPTSPGDRDRHLPEG